MTCRSYHHTAEDIRVPHLARGTIVNIRSNRINPKPSARTKRQEASDTPESAALDPDQRRCDIPPSLRHILRRGSHLGRRESALPIPRARDPVWPLPFDSSRLDPNAVAVLILCLPHAHLLRGLPADCSGQRRASGPGSSYGGSLPQKECERRDMGS